jgi:DNA uptake protein ComE-like DNA-binding protein
MSRNTVIGSLILLAVTAIAVIFHYTAEHTIFFKTRFQDSMPLSPVSSLTPEHKFLVHGPIDINSATAEELEAIPRVGPGLAERIHGFVEEKNGIKDIQELLEVKGVGPKILKIIRPYLKIGN